MPRRYPVHDIRGVAAKDVVFEDVFKLPGCYALGWGQRGSMVGFRVSIVISHGKQPT